MSADYTGIPIKLTDAWADWVVRKLAANGETALTDEDIAAIISNTKAVTRTVLNQLIGNAGDATIQLATEYTDDAVQTLRDSIGSSVSSGDIRSVASAKAYTDTTAQSTLSEAKAYTDEHASTGGVSQKYVDDADAKIASDASSALAAARNALTADISSRDAATLAEAKANVVAQLAAYVSRETYDEYIETVPALIQATSAQLDIDVLAQAKAYADEHAGGGGSDEYVDEQVGQARADLTAAINSSRDAAVQSAATYTDDAIETAAGGTSELVDGKIADVRSYVDEQDAYILQQAKAYTDQSGSGGGSGGVTQGYVDNGDSTTLASARSYTDTKATDTLGAARSYADAYARPASGWTKAQLETAVQTSLNKADTAAQPPSALVAFTVDTNTYTPVQFGYRINNGDIEFYGTLKINTGTFAANSTINVATGIPTEARPGVAVRVPIVFQGIIWGTCQISTAGTITIYTGATTGDTVYFSGVRYPKL